MATGLNVRDYRNGKLITLSRPYRRSAMLNWIIALMYLTSAIGFSDLLLHHLDEGTGAKTFLSLAIIGFLIAFYRFISKATEVEKLFVKDGKLEIIIASIFKFRSGAFKFEEISDFRFNERQKYEPHPLKGDSVDYLGFQSQQRIIEELYGDGRVSFIYQGMEVRFGKNLTSWEFSELEVLLYDLTGNDFRYTDQYEKEHFPEA